MPEKTWQPNCAAMPAVAVRQQIIPAKHRLAHVPPCSAKQPALADGIIKSADTS
jgi:hypothetical protein